MHSSRLWSLGSSFGFVVLYGGATLVILADGVMNPDRLGLSLGFSTLGLFGTWRQYLPRGRRPMAGVPANPGSTWGRPLRRLLALRGRVA
jgi:hypothetical protein